MKVVVDEGPCKTDLRSWCLGIALSFLITITLNVIFLPSAFNIIGFVITVIANVCLLFGCLRYNALLVLIWMISALIFAIAWPIAVIGTIFHFGGFRESTGFNNVFMALIVQFIFLVFMAFCARIVYSYYLQLKNRESNPQHAVVV